MIILVLISLALSVKVFSYPKKVKDKTLTYSKSIKTSNSWSFPVYTMSNRAKTIKSHR